MLPSQESYDIVIVGGGFFGTYLALQLQKNLQLQKTSSSKANKKNILIIEREDELLKRASLVNQARIHGGYHYPRSLVTGLRSQENYRLFLETFADCVEDKFIKYYAISKNSSAVTAQQFKLFCNRIAAPLSKAPVDIVKEFNPAMIEEVFVVEECAFNAAKLRKKLTKELLENEIEVCTETEAYSVKQIESTGGISIKINATNAPQDLHQLNASKVFLCTYSCINEILCNSALPQIPIFNEFAEMCLVKPSGFLQNAGVTVMCGPFFSVMPYPTKGLHTLSHVRYTPHFSWEENDSLGAPRKSITLPRQAKSHYVHMQKDAQRYLPILKDLQYRESIWENKTLLPRNEMDDARPILLKENHGLSNLTCIIGAKIDNVFDVCSALGLNN